MKRFFATAGAFSLMLGIGSAYASNNLSRVYVHHVVSSKGGTELIPQGGSWTARDHGGATFQIVTDEIGYGHGAQARLLGTPLREIKYESLCNVGGRLGSCRNGATIVGHRSTWDASGREGGNFEVVVLPSGSGGPKRATLQIR
ncbi:MAG TPA: DUF4879 domain-containing protein [Luteibacter sp.]|uniref:DUF4879 domain-containing protein n=1 Tax=Luteibacter sp. TaxID=1886636 RepID=UPI002C5376E3|nr:DUF4879 domain-containing protein [Luteibacter sp.]HVI55049.1 DUF4879 domain-containing protein [Luteibacter sp.]